MKIVKKIQPKIVIFTAVKNRCMLHGHVFVMSFLFPFKYKILFANSEDPDQMPHNGTTERPF